MQCVKSRRGGNVRRHPIAPLMVAIVLAVSCAIAPVARAAAPDADSQALRTYALSFDKAQHYAVASKALKKDADTKADIGAEIKQMQVEPQHSLADIDAMMSRHPKIYAYFQHEGLSLHDTVILPLVLVSAMSAADSPSPEKFSDDVSPDQLAFARQHMPELKALFSSGDASSH